MLRIAVCDDQPRIADTIGLFAREYYREMRVESDVTVFYSGEALQKAFRAEPFEVALLDIQMPGLNGVQLGCRLRDMAGGNPLYLVFITGFAQYRKSCSQLHSVAFIKKPFGRDKVNKALDRVELQRGHTREVLSITSGYKKISLPMDEVLYMKATRNGVEVVCAHRSLLWRQNLEDVMQDLPSRFAWTRRSCVVNLEHIYSLQKDRCQLDNGEVILMSRSYKNSFRKYYLKWGNE